MAERLGDILADGRFDRPAGQELAGRKWAAVVGAELSVRTRVVGYRGGRLEVEVASSALLQELSGLYRDSLIESIGEGPDAVVVRDIKFTLGDFDA